MIPASVAPAIDAPIDAIAAPIETVRDTIAFAIQALRELCLTLGLRPFRQCIEPTVDAITSRIQAIAYRAHRDVNLSDRLVYRAARG